MEFTKIWKRSENVSPLATGLALLLATGSGCATLSPAKGEALGQAELSRQAEDYCAGVPAKDREQGLLAYRDSFARATPLVEDAQVGKVKISRTSGESIVLRAAPSITLPWLDRVNSCHVALVQAGRLNPGQSDPFVVPGTRTAIAETYDGYVLSIKATGTDALKDVVARTSTVMAAARNPSSSSLTAQASAD